jgi:hypothetical protein
VWRVDGTSRNVNRPDFVACAFQSSENSVEVYSDSRRVLKQEPSGPDAGNSGNSFVPEEAVILASSLLAGDGHGLARGTAREEIDPAFSIT